MNGMRAVLSRHFIASVRDVSRERTKKDNNNNSYKKKIEANFVLNMKQ